MDTFLVRTLLVPSTVILLGRWNWWPGRLSQQPADRPGDDGHGGGGGGGVPSVPPATPQAAPGDPVTAPPR
jgi:hypothetical protein